MQTADAIAAGLGTSAIRVAFDCALSRRIAAGMPISSAGTPELAVCVNAATCGKDLDVTGVRRGTTVLRIAHLAPSPSFNSVIRRVSRHVAMLLALVFLGIFSEIIRTIERK